MVAPLSRCTVGRRLLSILALWAVTFPGAVLADSLWIVEPARDAVVEAHDVETLLRDLLRYDTATTHIVGLSEVETRMRRQRSSPDCLTGLESCDPARGVLTDWLEIDRTLVVEPLGTGRQLRVTERITGERQTRTLTVETDSLRESLLRVVSELQQTEAIVDIRTQPSGATVRHGDRVVGQTPLDQVRLPAGNVRLRVEAEGYAPLEFEEELRPGERRTLRRELRRLFSTLLVTASPASAELHVGDPLEAAPLGTPIRLMPGTHRIRIEAEGFDPIDEEIRLGAAEDRIIERQLRPSPDRLRAEERARRRTAHLRLQLQGRLAWSSPAWEDASGTGSRSDLQVACAVSRSDATECARHGTAGLGLDAGVLYSRGLLDLEVLGLGHEALITPSDGIPIRYDNGAVVEGRGGSRTEIRFLQAGLRTFLGDTLEPHFRTGPAVLRETLGKKGGGLPEAQRYGLAWQVRLGLRSHLSDSFFLTGSAGWSIPLTWREPEPTFTGLLGVGVSLTPWARSAMPALFPNP